MYKRQGIGQPRLLLNGKRVNIRPQGQYRTGLALRADIDALPIQEETGLPYASTEMCIRDRSTDTVFRTM